MSSSYSNDEREYIVETTGSANASLTNPVRASLLRKNGFVMLKSHPCKIIDISISKPGKHGHAKCNFAGKDVFTGAKVEDVSPSSHNMDVPIVKRTEYHVIHITQDGFLQLLNLDGLREDVRCPEGEVGEKIKSLVAADNDTIVTVLSTMGKDIAIDAKERAED